MSSSSVTHAVIALAEEAAAHSEPAIHPYVVGAVSLALLLALLISVVAFGGGREHT